MTEFNLSDQQWTTPKGDGFELKDVKEFIKRLKDGIMMLAGLPTPFKMLICKLIDKLAGPKLC